MVVSIRGTPTSGTATATSIVTNKPTGVVVGDVMLLRVGWDASGGAITPPTGWTLLQAQPTPVGFNHSVYGKVAGTGEPSTYTTSIATSAFIAADITAYQGCDPASFLSAVPTSTKNSGTGVTSTGTGVTANRPGCKLVHFATSDTGARSSGPAGMANELTYDTNNYVDDVTVNIGATGNKTSTYTSQGWSVIMVLVQPAMDSVAPPAGFRMVGPGRMQKGPSRRGIWPTSQVAAAAALASWFQDDMPERTLPPAAPRAPSSEQLRPLFAPAALPDPVQSRQPAPAFRQPVDQPWAAPPLATLGSLPGNDLPRVPPLAARRSPEVTDLPPLAVTGTAAALPDPAPFRPAQPPARRSPAESWVAETPPSMPQDAPPARQLAPAAPRDLTPWLLPPVAQVSAALADPLPPRPAGTRPRQDLTPWDADPLLFPYALPDPLVRLPPVNRPPHDRFPWILPPVAQVSAAIPEPLLLRPRGTRPVQDVAPWAAPPLFYPFALPDPQPHRPPPNRPARDVTPWSFQALQAISAALSDPAPFRPLVPTALRTADPWVLAPLFSPYALQDGAPARAPRALLRTAVELWLLSPLAAATSGALPDPPPAPPRSIAPPRTVTPPWELFPLAARSVWHQADPTTPIRSRPHQEYEPWVLPALPYNQTPNSWNTVPPPPRWVNRPPQDLTPWALPQASTAGPWRPWDGPPARPPLRAPRALDPAWALSPLVRPFLPADAVLGPTRALPARVPGPPWDLRALSPSPWHQADPTRPPAPTQRQPSAPWDLAALARSAALPDPPALRPRPPARPPATDANVLWALVQPVLGRFLEDTYRRPIFRQRFPHEAAYQQLPGSAIYVPVTPPPREPLPVPFLVQLLGDDGAPVDLTGLTVLLRTQPADRRRSAIVEPAEVVDARRGLVRKIWTSEDVSRTKTGVMLIQYVTIDLAGRPRTYPGGARYYQEDFIRRGRRVQ